MFRQNKKKTPKAIDNQGFIFFRKWYHLYHQWFSLSLLIHTQTRFIIRGLQNW